MEEFLVLTKRCINAKYILDIKHFDRATPKYFEVHVLHIATETISEHDTENYARIKAFMKRRDKYIPIIPSIPSTEENKFLMDKKTNKLSVRPPNYTIDETNEISLVVSGEQFAWIEKPSDYNRLCAMTLDEFNDLKIEFTTEDQGEVAFTVLNEKSRYMIEGLHENGRFHCYSVTQDHNTIRKIDRTITTVMVHYTLIRLY